MRLRLPNLQLHAVERPLRRIALKTISQQYPHEICILPYISFFYPAYFEFHVNFMHEQDEFIFLGEGGFQYAYRFSPAAEKHLWKLTLEHVVSNNTSFTRLIRRFLPEDVIAEIRKVTAA